MSEQGRSLSLVDPGRSSRQREEQAERMEVVEPVGGPGKSCGRSARSPSSRLRLWSCSSRAPTIVGRVGRARSSRDSEAPAATYASRNSG